MTASTLGPGKWAQSDVPHRGWTCVGIEDLGAPAAICEMCERQEIRYVHFMEHPDHAPLACGCICAGHMEENLIRAKARETKVKAVTHRRSRWLDLKGWYRSRHGNLTIHMNGFTIVVFPKGEGWGGLIEHVRTQRKRFARRTYPTRQAAQLAAFDAMVVLESKNTL